MRRATGVVLLVSVVVVAGCSSLGGSQPATEDTLTPVPVSTDSTEGGDGDDRIAPGLTRDGIVDSRQFLHNHAVQLDNTSYTLHRRVSRRGPNGSIRSTSETVVYHNATAVRVRHNRTVFRDENRTLTRVERWSVDDTTYTAIFRDEETTYVVSTSASGDGRAFGTADFSESLSQILSHLPVTVGAPVVANGTTVYPLSVTERRDVFPLRNVSFVGNVTERGILTEYRLEYEVSDGDTPVRVTVHKAVTTGRAPVVRPDWVPEAVNATS